MANLVLDPNTRYRTGATLPPPVIGAVDASALVGPPPPPGVVAATAPPPDDTTPPVPDILGRVVGATPEPLPPPLPADQVANLSAPPGSTEAIPKLAPPKKSLGQRLAPFIELAGAIGSGMANAGDRTDRGQTGQQFEQSLAANRAARLKAREFEEVEKPKAQATVDYLSGKNETAEKVAGTRVQGAKDVQGLKNTGQIELQNVKDKGAYQRELLRQGAPMLITPEMAELAEQPNLAGQMVSGATLKNFAVALRAHGAGIKDLGTEGMWVTDNTGRKLHQISVSSPSMTRAVAGRQAGVTDVYDEQGNLVPLTDSERLARGLPKAQTEFSQQGPTASTRTAGQAAGAVASHIPEFKQAVLNLERKGQLGPVMGRLNEFLTRGYGGNDPDVSKFLTTLKLLKSGAVRAHFGARGGAQILQSFDQTLNPGMTANAINGSIDAIGDFLNTYGDIGKFQPVRGGAPTGGGAGGGKTLDEATAAKLLREAGGDKNKARALAKQRGYKF